MTLPNFLIIGAQKCGTTSLHDILSKHPETNMSVKKEINFFIKDKKYNKGLGYYSKYFKNNKNAIAIGEASPGYICHPDVHKRIYESLGIIKIVIILRDPIKRAFSQYWDERRELTEHLSEEEIVEKHLENVYNPYRRGYFSRGVYINDVIKYVDLFGKKNVHVIILEELIKNQKENLQDLYMFLGINKHQGFQTLPKPSNSAVIYKNRLYMFFFNNPAFHKFLPKRGKGVLLFGKKEVYRYQLPEKQILKKLKRFYKPYNEKLAGYLGKPLKHWM